MKDRKKKSEAFRNFEKGNYSRSDFRTVQQVFEQKDDAELMDLLKQKWQSIPEGQTSSKPATEAINDVIASTIPTRKTTVKLLLNYYQRAAAVLLIPIVLFSVYWFMAQPENTETSVATIYSPPGARTSFVLPDGSTGWLNSDSKLTYPVQFASVREVQLDGEAYFHVKHQQKQKFQVRTPNLTVQVLGTKFDVSAYNAKKEVSVILQEGSVQILDKNDEASYLMKPNEKFAFDVAEKKAVVSEVNATEHTSWTEGILSFKGESLEEVMNKLARWYNVDIEIHDEQLQSYNFKATFQNEPLEEILRMVALTTPLKYRIEERKLNSNGIYAKKKIIIDKK